MAIELPTFTSPNVGSERDSIDLHGLPQFVERDKAAIEKCTSVDRWMDTLRVAIKETHTQCVLQAGDCFRYDGIRDGKLLRCSRHAPRIPRPQTGCAGRAA